MSGRNILTVDVERWYDGIPSLCRSGILPSNLEKNIHLILELLARYDVKATFFWLGCLAEDNPGLVSQVAAAGHETGCHGWGHEPVEDLGPVSFRNQTEKALEALSSIVGSRITTYRAPFFSITRRSFWAMDILTELGIVYDSSILPAGSWRYGFTDFPRGISVVETPFGDITEVPVSTCPAGPVRFATGGGWFRFLPCRLTDRCFKRLQENGQPGVFYFHPWEMDTDPPVRSFEPRAWICHYFHRKSAAGLLESFISTHSFTSLQGYMEAERKSDGTEDGSVQIRE